MAHLNERQRRIVALVAAAGAPVTGAKIADELGVSLRTVQNEISHMNRCETTLLSSRHGYSLCPEADLSCLEDDRGGSVGLARAALEIVARRLLVEKTPLTTSDVSEALFVSARSADRLLSSVRTELARFGLELSRSHGQLSVSGTREDKSRLLAQLVLDEMARPGELGDQDSIANLLDLGFVRDIVTRSVHRAAHYLEPGYEMGLHVNVAIALLRMRTQAGHSAAPTSGATLERSVARTICEEYSRKWPISPDDMDINCIASLLGGHIRPEGNRNETITPRVSDALLRKVEGILERALSPYGVTARGNRAVLDFAVHVEQLIRRFPLQVADNGTLATMTKSCPFAFEISQLVADGISEVFGVEVGAGELGLICIHVGMIIGEAHADRIRMALVNETYHDVGRDLRDRLIGRFGEQADVILYSSADDLLASNTSVDLVLTTGRAPRMTVPCVQISPLLVGADLVEVQRAVVSCLERRRDRTLDALRDFFSPDLFFRDEGTSDEGPLERDDALTFLSERLRERNIVDESYLSSVMRRESAGSTCFFALFAIPHAIEMNARETRFCVLVSERGINWSGTIIHLVLMIAVCERERSRFMGIFDSVVKALSERGRTSALASAHSLDEFLSNLGLHH